MMEFKAVLLAAGKGSRLTDLTSSLPKCLLPVGNYPLIWYPLRMLHDCGVTSVVVTISESELMKPHENEIATIPHRYGGLGDRNLEVVVVPGKDDPGTADTLRFLKENDYLRGAMDIILVSCDLLTPSSSLRKLITLHRLEEASLSALFASPTLDLSAVTVPGPKSKYKPERDLVGLTGSSTSDCRRLGLLVSEADFEESVDLRVALMRRFPRLLVRSDLLDAHLYIVRPWLLDFVCRNPGLASLKGEVIPEVVRAQYGRAREKRDPETPSDSVEEGTEQATSVNDCYVEDHYAELIRQFNSAPDADFISHGQRVSKVSCFGFLTTDITVRANTLPAYLAINREVAKLWESMTDPRPARIHPKATVPEHHIQISEDTVIGNSARLSEKSSFQRCVIGAHCIIGSKVRMSDCVVMDHVEVQDGSSFNNCILMCNSTVSENCELKDCVVGAGHVVPAGVKKSREIISEQGGAMEVY